MYLFTERLSGMNQITEDLKLKEGKDRSHITRKVLECAYLAPITIDVDKGHFEFSGRTMLNDHPIFLTMDVNENGSIKSTIKSENTVLNSVLMKVLKQTLLS